MRNIRIVLIGLFGVFLLIHLTVTTSHSYTISLTQDYLYNTVSLRFYKNGEMIESYIQSSFSTDAALSAFKYGYQVYNLSIGQSGGEVHFNKDAFPYYQDDYQPYEYSISGYTEGDYTLMISGDPGFVFVDYEKTYQDNSIFVGFMLPQIGFGAPFPSWGEINDSYPHYAYLEGSEILQVGKPYGIHTYYSFVSQPPGWHTATLQILDVRPVPEPATMLLLGSGLIGLAGYGRKKFFKK